MNKIDIKSKLTSRKLWAAVASAAVCLATAFFGEELTPEVVSVMRYAVGAMVAYIFGEGAVDIARLIADALKLTGNTAAQAEKTEETTTPEEE